jgi:hypothetical protein
MKRASLRETNPHLRDPAQFQEDLIWSVATSTAIETGESVEAIAKDLRRFLAEGSPSLTPARPK